MIFGLVTKAYLERRLSELTEEMRKAEWESKQWYDKFRALYARMVKRGPEGNGTADREGSPVQTPGAEAPSGTPLSAERVAAAKERFWRSRR